jgi:hypothetical protein
LAAKFSSQVAAPILSSARINSAFDSCCADDAVVAVGGGCAGGDAVVGAPFKCINHNVSQVNGTDYTCIWTGHPPRSPVVASTPVVEVTLLPFGATDLRITELPTVRGS